MRFKFRFCTTEQEFKKWSMESSMWFLKIKEYFFPNKHAVGICITQKPINWKSKRFTFKPLRTKIGINLQKVYGEYKKTEDIIGVVSYIIEHEYLHYIIKKMYGKIFIKKEEETILKITDRGYLR